MKKLFFVLMLLLFLVAIGRAVAAPWLVCDPQAGVTEYRLTGPAWVPLIVVAETNGSIRMDVSPSGIGVSSLTVKACKGVWCSDPVPFDFTRPTVTVPLNIGLSN